jgi:thiol-disulfide isomerase/thioredoxin
MKRCVAISLFIVAAPACHPHKRTVSASRQGLASSDLDAESGQGRALEAGRALVGKRAPAAVLKTIDGQAIDLSKIYGHEPVYLKFWATWCVYCREQMPGFEADFEKLRDRIVTIAVNTGFNDDIDKVRAYRRELGLKMPIVIDDGSLGGAFNLRVTPQHIVIGRDGRVVYVGQLDDERLHAAFRDAIAESPAPKPATAGAGPPASSKLPQIAGLWVAGPTPDATPRVLVFFATWCEDYLKQSRPAAARACRRVRGDINELSGSRSIRWLGIGSGLWTTEKDFADYRLSKNAYRIPLHLDSNGVLFRAFHVRDVPTVIILDQRGRVAKRLGPKDTGLKLVLSKMTKA